MKKVVFVVTLFSIFAWLVSLAYADLNTFLKDLNAQAATDRTGYNTKLSTQFNIPLSRAESIVKSVDSAADAFMVLQLESMSGKSHDVTYNTYKKNKKKGWGVIAQELGIKPGSPEFHALKNGDFVFSGKPGEKGHRTLEGEDKDKDKDKDLSSGKGQGKDKGKDLATDLDTSKGKGKGKTK